MAPIRKTRRHRRRAVTLAGRLAARMPRRAVNRRAAAGHRTARTIKASLREGAPSAGLLSFLPDSIPLPWLKFAIGLALFPLCWITTEAALAAFARITLHARFWRSPEFWFFGMGSLMWLVVFFGIKGRALLFLYVLGHELTHAFFALLCGARVERVRVSSSGGHILTDKNNVLISLSPYFVPFYTLLLLGVYAAASHLFAFEEIHNRILFAAIGATWTFHLTFTVWMIFKNQPDLRQNGTFFSLTLIYLINLLLIAALFIAASPQLACRDFGTTWLTHAYTFVPRFVASVQDLVRQL